MKLNDTLIAIWLKLALDDSSTKTYKVFKHFGDFEKVHEASYEELKEIPELKEKEIEALMNKDLHEAGNVAQVCTENFIEIITITDERYPKSLLELNCPPCVLFVSGNFDKAVSKPCIAVVGTRSCTEYGKRITSVMSGGLAVSGCTIVTGIANGIDEAAYMSAVKANGTVILVLPDGLFFSKPKTKILKSETHNTVVISEHLPYQKQTKFAYQERNRIISGLSCCCLVTQAPESSGALITANYTIEQGKELFVVPANIDIPQSVGSNKLFYDGAIPVFNYIDILENMNIQYDKDLTDIYAKSASYFDGKTSYANKQDIETFKKMFAPKLPEKTLKVLACFEDKPLSFDYIIKNTNLPVREVSSQLSHLETLDIIEALPGGNYKLNFNTKG